LELVCEKTSSNCRWPKCELAGSLATHFDYKWSALKAAKNSARKLRGARPGRGGGRLTIPVLIVAALLAVYLILGMLYESTSTKAGNGT
jgi:hypothetical protein